MAALHGGLPGPAPEAQPCMQSRRSRWQQAKAAFLPAPIG